MKQCCLLLAAAGLMFLAINLSAQTTETQRFAGLNRPVPDGHASGLSDRRTVNSTVSRIARLRVKLAVAGEFNGDLYAYLRHVSATSTNFCVLLNRPGKSDLLPSGFGDAGLSVIFDDAAASGDIHAYRNAATPAAGTSLTGIWKPDGRAVNPETVLDSSPRSPALGSFNGADPDGEWTLFIADLESGGTNLLAGWELEITGPITPEIAWPAPADIVYGTALGAAQFNASSPTAGNFIYSPSSGTVLNAATGQVLSVTFQPGDTNGFVTVIKTVSLTVLKKALTITANDAAKVYGQALPALSATFTGFVNSDTPASLDSPVVLNTSAITASPAGSYPITASGGADVNYEMTFVNGTLSIGRAGAVGNVATSLNPALPGQTVMLTFQLNAVAPGAGLPTGVVQFVAGGVAFGAPAPINSGLATLNASSLPAGLHTIKAWFEGDANFLGVTNALVQSLLINTPPTATADTMQRVSTNIAKVLLSALLANDSDADGNAFTFVSLSPTGAVGGTVSLNAPWVYYTPPAGSTNGDSFTYTITDGFTSATGTVMVTIQSAPVPAPNLAISDLADGSFLLRFDGLPAMTYRIEWTDDVALAGWQTLGSSTADAFGAFTFVDLSPGGRPRRFYRSVHP